MIGQLHMISDRLGLSSEMIIMIGLGLGVLLVFLSIASVMAGKNPAAARMSAAVPGTRRQARQNRGLLRGPTNAPGALMKSFVPGDEKQRSELQTKLAQAGFIGSEAMRNFTMVRVLLGLVFPGFLLLLIVASKTRGFMLPYELGGYVTGLSNLQVFQLLSVLVGVGFFGPVYWLNGRVSERRRKIEEGFPNALDLMQISVESGLGFDSAMTRVGNELEEVSPEIAQEFLSVQMQVQAGRPRDVAMQDMATRTGVETVRSFANVVQQSMQFGTSMSDGLNTYSKELREYREMRAQEMANQLPVKMSAVLASLMLPALIMLTVGPVVIRYIRFYGG